MRQRQPEGNGGDYSLSHGSIPKKVLTGIRSSALAFIAYNVFYAIGEEGIDMAARRDASLNPPPQSTPSQPSSQMPFAGTGSLKLLSSQADLVFDDTIATTKHERVTSVLISGLVTFHQSR